MSPTIHHPTIKVHRLFRRNAIALLFSITLLMMVPASASLANPIAPVPLVGEIRLLENGEPYYLPTLLSLICQNPEFSRPVQSSSLLCMQRCLIQNRDFYSGNDCTLTIRTVTKTIDFPGYFRTQLYDRMAQFVFTSDIDIEKQTCAMAVEELRTERQPPQDYICELKAAGAGERQGFPLASLLLALVSALIVETVAAIVFIRGVFKYSDIDHQRIVAAVIFINIITVPLVWLAALNLIDPHIGSESVAAAICVIEMVVVVIEALAYGSLLKIARGHALVVSLVANIISYVAGKALFGGF